MRAFLYIFIYLYVCILYIYVYMYMCIYIYIYLYLHYANMQICNCRYIDGIAPCVVPCIVSDCACLIVGAAAGRAHSEQLGMPQGLRWLGRERPWRVLRFWDRSAEGRGCHIWRPIWWQFKATLIHIILDLDT